MSEFKKEERYVVLKLKHMTDQERNVLNYDVLGRLRFSQYQTECVVVESGWSIYEQTWDAVQRLTEGRTQRIEELEQRLAEAQNTVNALREGYAACLVDLESWATYASDYFQQKHDLQGNIKNHQDTLDKSPTQHTAEHDADVIEDMLDTLDKHTFALAGAYYPEESIRGYAQQLRNSVKEGRL